MTLPQGPSPPRFHPDPRTIGWSIAPSHSVGLQWPSTNMTTVFPQWHNPTGPLVIWQLCLMYCSVHPLPGSFNEMPTNRWVESSFWNFDALFQPQSHPARDSHDTFFLSSTLGNLGHNLGGLLQLLPQKFRILSHMA